MKNATRIRRRGRRHGMAMLEFAMVLPIILALLLNMIQFGLLSQATEIVTNLSREGARFATQRASATDADIQSYVLTQAEQTALGRGDLSVVITPAQGTGTSARQVGGQVKVEVAYNLSRRIFLPGTRWMLAGYERGGQPIYTAQTTMRILAP